MLQIWELSSGAHTPWLQLSLYGREGRKDFWEDQSPNCLGIYRVKSISLKGNFKQIGRLWEIGIMHSLWLIPLSCWAEEFSLCRSFWVILKADTLLKEIKPTFIQVYLQPKVYNHLDLHILKEKLFTQKTKQASKQTKPKKLQAKTLELENRENVENLRPHPWWTFAFTKWFLNE